jgi:NAD+ kinase
VATLGIWPNPEKELVRGITLQLCRWLDERSVATLLPPDLAEGFGIPERGRPLGEWDVDGVVVLGGDGTLLRAAKEVGQRGWPLLGVNLGHVGFLTEVEVPDLYPTLEAMLEGQMVLDLRLLLRATVVRQGAEVASFAALNDVVVAKGPFARLVRLETFVDDAYVTTWRADGLIAATPTGSTAYSLSAGGPVVTPNLGVMLLTPICPHSFFDRSIVIGEESHIRIRVSADHRETLLTVDGQEGFQLEDGDEVHVERDPARVKLLRRPGANFFQVLRSWQRGR